jgi:pectin methylesterase-like acyl-CoA thioesterase
MKVTKRVKKLVSLIAASALIIASIPQGFMGIVSVKAADPEITEITTTYDFQDNATKAKPEMEKVLAGTDTDTSGILYKYGEGSGCTFDANQLRFRNKTILYIPIKNDTTKINYAYLGSSNNAGRPTYLGSTDSGYTLAYNNVETNVVIDDITDYIVTVGTQKYFPIISGGDIKIKYIKFTEYNPINSVTVSGNVANAAANGVTKIKFKNLDNAKAEIITADVDASGNYTAVLRRVAGNTNYSASISKTGFKIDDASDANRFTLSGNSATSTNNFSVVEAPSAKITGTVTGVPDEFLKGDLGVALVPSDAAMDNVDLALTKVADGSYTYTQAFLNPDVDYAVKLTNADDYEVTAVINKAEGVYSDVAFTATKKATYQVSGSFVTNNDKTATVTSVTFTNMDTPTYTYTFAATAGSYTANLRKGEYTTSVVSEGYTAYDHVSVKDADVTNDIYLVGEKDTSKVAYKDTVNVGTGEQFETITKALEYIARMDRGENDVVTINLLDAQYREQVIVDIPNITITSSRTSGSTITWYYGVGYSYYSAKQSTDGKTGCYYDEGCAVDKYYQGTISQNPGHWGATVNLFAGAKGFKAENVTFENSLNRYMTTEEVADGVTTNVAASLIDRSTATNADVLKKANKERSCTIYIQADDTEYKDCKFLSSQDTIYTGDDNENSYFVDCVIEGNTDYICGDGNPVFDKCTLSMYCYSDQAATESYIAASKDKGTHGYLFNNCKIVTTSFPGLMATSGNILCRAWGPGKVVFLNTEVESADIISAAAYKDMNAKVTDAHYYEYNTHTPDGTKVDTSGRAQGVTIMTDDAAAEVSLTSYFDGWRPTFYYADYTAVDAAVSAANGLNAGDYEDFSAVQAALDAVNNSLTLSEQTTVDNMAKAINDAISKLVLKSADNGGATTGDTGATGTNSNAQTGDTLNAYAYIILLIAAFMAGCTCLVIRRKKAVK